MSASTRLQECLSLFGLPALPPAQADLLGAYAQLLLRWNGKVNLTSIRDEPSILRRHLVESIQCARLLPQGCATMLDFGSGGGFPGIPCAICRPEFAVTLAESQSRKVAFLREAVRHLKLTASVHGARVDALPADRRFDVVTLRAVDRMPQACVEAFTRVKVGGWIAVLTTEGSSSRIVKGVEAAWKASPLAGSEQQVLLLGRRLR